MIELLVAVVSLVGLVFVELIRRSSNDKKELLTQISKLNDKIDSLQDEVDEWKEKYFLVLREK